MGSLDTKPDPGNLEPKHETGSNKTEPPVDSSTTSGKNDLLELMSTSDSEDDDKKVFPLASPSSSISLTDSTLKDPLQDSDSKNGGKVDEGIDDKKILSPLASPSSSISLADSTLKDSFQDSDSKNGGKVNEGTDYTSETPPIQVMERPTTPKCRIPSSVFARNQSASQDWAMASNESLFSIQMSFNYQDSMNWRSGDLERYVQEVRTIPESNETGKDHDLHEPGKTPKFSGKDKNHGVGDINKNHGSSIPDGPVNPNSQENQGRKSVVDPRISHVSAESESAKSFTFPILTGDTDKGGSARQTGSLEAISEQPEPEKQSQPKPKPKPAASWTNCFGCCTLCS